MGYGPVINGKQRPITPWKGSWAATVNNPDPEQAGRMRKDFREKFVATSSGSLRLPGTFDKYGRKISD